MKGVTMSVGTPVTLAVILYLGTVIEATYLERPLWVSDMGRQQSVSRSNEESRFGQFQVANEQAWKTPELNFPQRAGSSNYEWVENQQRQPQDSPNAPQTAREERLPLDGFGPNQGYDGWNSPDTAYEYQTNYQAQGMINEQPPQQYQPPAPQQQQQQKKPSQQYQPPQQQQQQYQPQPQQTQQQYQPPQQQMQPLQQNQLSSLPQQQQQSPQQQKKPSQQYQPPQQQQYQPPQQQQQYQPQPQQSQQQYQPPQQQKQPSQQNQLSSSPQQQQQSSQQQKKPSQQQQQYQLPQHQNEHQQPYLTLEPSKLQSQPEPDYYDPYGQQGWNREPKPENSQPNNYQSPYQTQEKYQPYRTDSYKPKPDADTQMTSNQPKPGSFEPNQSIVEPIPLNAEKLHPNNPPKRPPQEVQQSYNPYPARPELYQPGPSFGEPQKPHFGQQALPAYTDPEYQMQMLANKQPTPQSPKPVEQPNKVVKPQPENQVGQSPLTNPGYNPYQSQEAWHQYQQNPTEGFQAPVQTGPDTHVGNSMTIYQLPSQQGSYGREPTVEKPKPVDRVTQQQEIRKPPQPPKAEQRPNRPLEQAPEEPMYQPNRMPSTTWDTQYKPQPAPTMPKPKPQPRPPIVEPTYNRRPEQYYGGNDDEDDGAGVKYEKPITRFDNRCPRDDNPAKPVHFPSPNSCVKFQKCFNGVAYEMSCPGGLEFDSTSNRCDYPARARCSV